MQIIHTIRLHGPWLVSAGTIRQKVRMPTTWEEVDCHDAADVVLERSFGRPTGVESERVYLVVEGINADWQLNGAAVQPDAGRLDISDLMKERNKLLLTVTAGQGEIFTAARLEICAP